MDLPIELRSLIEEKLENKNIKNLQLNAQNISFKYREKSGKGDRLVTDEMEALAYAVVRMPATYGAIHTALQNIFEIYKPQIHSVLDVGAGTGAGTWAINSIIDFDEAVCLEREDVMMNLGKSLMKESDIEQLENVKWEKFDLINSELTYKADLVICSYVLNELNEKERMQALDKLWNATKKILVIIEPGTPVGFNEIKEMRSVFIKKGTIIAPCPNVENCPMKDDWCHSTCRVSRTKIHKLLKSGDVPYEDEKFSYIAVSKEAFEKKDFSRVLRHPKAESGRITLKICSKDGISEQVVTQKNKELYKKARKVGCGDLI